MKTELSSIFYLLSSAWLLAQPQEAWVARYNGGFTNKNHTPLALKLDAAGNIYLAGSSQNASNGNDYVVLKYAPGGQLLWAARHSATNSTDYTAKGFALGQDGSALLTGTGGTVKHDANGAVAWTTPYAGNDVAVDTNGNVYVTGYSAVEYATVKLDAAGSNQWVRTYAAISSPGQPVAISQKVAVDNAGNVYVAGWTDWSWFYSPGQTNPTYYATAAAIAYDGLGNAAWTNQNLAYDGQNWGQIVAVLPDNQGNVYVTGNNTGGGNYFGTSKISPSGQTVWWFVRGPPGVSAMHLDIAGSVYLTGGITSRDFTFRRGYGTLKLDTSGNMLWETNYFGIPPALTHNQASGLALDSSCGVYITGISTNSGAGNDWSTIKYDADGHQLWVKRYNGSANGNDGATGIAVAPDGSIYVTGYSANSSGGSDIVLIKYVMPATIQKKTDGSMQLQGYGLPSSNYTFQAATNLLNWDPIGSSIADTNGLFQFTDTNAPSFPFRFYRWTLP